MVLDQKRGTKCVLNSVNLRNKILIKNLLLSLVFSDGLQLYIIYFYNIFNKYILNFIVINLHIFSLNRFSFVGCIFINYIYIYYL